MRPTAVSPARICRTHAPRRRISIRDVYIDVNLAHARPAAVSLPGHPAKVSPSAIFVRVYKSVYAFHKRARRKKKRLTNDRWLNQRRAPGRRIRKHIKSRLSKSRKRDRDVEEARIWIFVGMLWLRVRLPWAVRIVRVRAYFFKNGSFWERWIFGDLYCKSTVW